MDAARRLANRSPVDLEVAQVRHGFPSGEAKHAVVDLAAEEEAEAVNGPARLREMLVERLEPVAVAVLESVEAGVEAGEGFAVRGQDEKV